GAIWEGESWPAMPFAYDPNLIVDIWQIGAWPPPGVLEEQPSSPVPALPILDIWAHGRGPAFLRNSRRRLPPLSVPLASDPNRIVDIWQIDAWPPPGVPEEQPSSPAPALRSSSERIEAIQAILAEGGECVLGAA